MVWVLYSEHLPIKLQYGRGHHYRHRPLADGLTTSNGSFSHRIPENIPAVSISPIEMRLFPYGQLNNTA
jgi:hypothetical protein